MNQIEQEIRECLKGSGSTVFFVDKKYEVYNKKYNEIEKSIDKELQEHPEDIRLLLIKIQILFRSKLDYNAAFKLCRTILLLDENNIDVRLEMVLILIYSHNRSKEDCLLLLDECKSIDSTYWRIYFVQSLFYIAFNQMNVLKGFLDKISKIYPDNLWIKVLNVQLNCDASIQQTTAVEHLKLLVKHNLCECDLLQRIAYVFLLSEKEDIAELIYLKTLELNPNSPKSLNNIGYIKRYKKQENKEAIKYCEAALKIDDRYEEAYFNIALSNRTLFNYDSCVQNLKRCIVANPHYQAAYKSLIATTSSFKKNKVLCCYYLQKFIQQFPSEHYGYYQYYPVFKENHPDFEYLENNQYALLNMLKTSEQKTQFNYNGNSKCLNKVFL